MHKIYLTAQINKTSSRTLKRSIEELNLISRRIILGGALPIVPALWFLDYGKDPRLKSSAKWWVKNIYSKFMAECDVLCYKPNLIGVDVSVVEAEKELWTKLKPTSPKVSSDVILDFLLNWSAKDVLNDLRRVHRKVKK